MRKYLFLFPLFLPLFSFAQPKDRTELDPLLYEFKSRVYKKYSDSNKADLIRRIASAYIKVSEDSTIYYANIGLQLSEKRGDKREQGLCLEVLGLVNYTDHNVALRYFFNALKCFEEVNDDRSKASVLRWIGGIYFNMEKYSKALDYFKNSLSIYENANDKNNIAALKHSIADTYCHLEDYPRALENEVWALKQFEESGDQSYAARAYSSIADIYGKQKKYNEALVYAHKGVRLQETLGTGSFYYAFNLNILGRTYFLIATDTITVIHPDSLLPEGEKANLEKAIKYYSAAYRAFPYDPFITTLKNWSEALRLMGKHEEALKLYKEYIEKRDSAISRDGLLKIAGQETEREIYLKDREIETNRLLEKNKNRERSLFAAIAVLLVLTVVFIWRNYKKEKRLKTKSDDLAINLQESLIQKDILAAQLSLAADMKTRFLANISHELRTPVTLLTGMLGLMKSNNEETNSPKNNDRLDVAYNNSRKLQYMVEEILDLSRIETSQTKLRTENKEISPILKRMVYAFETFIEKEQISLQYSENNVSGVHISADENMLEKVVNNLVYNAIKFNEQGGSIKAHLFTSADKTQFIFTINNSGSIIKAEDLPHVFERFYQGDTTTVKAEGVGIGLSLVKEFTLLMGGTVEATSMEGAGTTFTLQFPVTKVYVNDKEADIEIPNEITEAWEHFPERQTVLIVEDNAEMRYYLREVLSGKVNLAEAPNGKKALEWLEQNKADLVVTDLMMPEMDGEEFVGHLKANDIYKKIPVITLTARADTNKRLDMLRLGIDDYIIKPFDASELRVRVYNLLTNLEERRKFETAPTEQDDIPLQSKEAETFKGKVTTFVLSRMKTIDVSVYDLAYELNMSERQLYRLAKSLTGCTPAQLIKEVRLQKAYELLQGGTIYKVDDLAKQVGFDSPNYFSRQFYERFGKRPTEFL